MTIVNSWTSTSGGNWSVASDWSGGLPNSLSAVVAIALPGSYTITLAAAQSYSVGSLVLSSANATLQLQGTLTVGNTLTISSGTIALSGTIAGGTIVNAHSGISFQNGTLAGVTYAGVLDLSGGTTTGPSVNIVGGLVLEGANGIGNGTIQDTSPLGSTINFENTQTLNNATVNIGNVNTTSDALFEDNTTSSSQTLTLGSALVVNVAGKFAQIGTIGAAGGSIVNLGTINAMHNGAVLSISGQSFTNAGTINVQSAYVYAQNLTNAAGGTISIGGTYSKFFVTGTFANSGTITVASGGLLDFQSATTLTTAQLGTVQASSNTVEIDGTLNNSAATLNVGTGSSLGEVVLQGTVSGGTINDSGSGFAFSGGTLNGVTYDGTLDMSSFSYEPTLFISGGITVTGPGGAGPGTILVTGKSARLGFNNTQTIDNVTIELGNSIIGASLFENDTTGTGQTLTFGPNSTIDVVGYLATIGASNTNDTIVNQGTLEISTASSTLQVYAQNFVNQGKITVLATQAIVFESFTNTAGGTLSVAVNSTVTFNGVFSNSGMIAVANGGTVAFQQSATLTTTQLGNFQVSGGTILMGGVLNNVGSTLTVGPNSSLTVIKLANGTINGGTVVDSGSGIHFQDGTLNGVTYDGTIDMSSAAYQPYLDVTGGLTATGAGGMGPGLIQLTGTNATLSFINSQAFNNATINIGAGATTDSIVQANTTATGQTLTLGANLVINQAGLNAQLGSSGNSGNLIVSDGTIDAAFVAATFTIAGPAFTNAGKIIVGNDDTLVLQPGNFTNLSGGTLTGGYFEVDAQSVMQLAPNAVITIDNASIVLNGIASTIESLNTTSGAQVAIDTTLTAIGTAGSLALLGGRNFTTGAFTNAGQLVLGGGSFSAAGLTNAAGASIKGQGLLAAPVVNNGVIEASGGTLHLTQGAGGSGTFKIDAGASLILDGMAAYAQGVAFNGFGATLILDQPADFTGTVSGFVSGDQIYLPSAVATSVVVNSASQLLISANGTVIATVQLSAGASKLAYYVAPDARGGTDIGVGPYAPALVNVPGAQIAQAGQAQTIAGVSISDGAATAFNEKVTIVLSDTSGLLSATAAAGGTVTGSGTSSLVLSGSLAAVNAELATLHYTAPAAGGATSASIALSMTDSGGGSASGAIGISVNQPVVLTAPGSTLQLVAGTSYAIGGITIADADAFSAGETLTVVVSDSVGLLSATAAWGATIQGEGTTSLTLSGSLIQVAGEIATLSYDAPPGTQSGDTITIAASDGRGSTGSAHIAVSLDQPVIINAPQSATFVAGVLTKINWLSVSDADAVNTNEILTVTVSDRVGILTASAAAGGSVSVSGTSSITFTGTLNNINADLATLAYHDNPSGGPPAADTITVTGSDGHGSNPIQTIGVAIIAQSTSWKRGLSGDWGTASLWTGGAPDSVNGDAVINLAAFYTVGIAGGESFAVRNLAIGTGRATLAITGSLTVAGLVSLTAGTLQMSGGVLDGAIAVGPKASLVTGAGTIDGSIANTGPILASGGLLDITGAVTGTGGTLTISSGAALEVGAVANSQAVYFTAGGTNETLMLSQPAAMQAPIYFFGAGMTIDVANAAVTSDSYARGALVLYSGTTQIATLAVDGSYAGQVFALSSDGSGGTDITLAPDSPPAITAPGAVTIPVNTATAIGGVSVADPDAVAMNQTITVTLTDSYGRLSVNSVTAAVVTHSGSAAVRIVGTLAQVDGDLATLTDLTAKAVSDTITITASDGNGGVATPVTIAVTGVAANLKHTTSDLPSRDLLAQFVAAGFAGTGTSALAGQDAAAGLSVHLDLLAAAHR